MSEKENQELEEEQGGEEFSELIKYTGGTMAQAYGWGKLLGMGFPWIIDWGSRLLGINV